MVQEREGEVVQTPRWEKIFASAGFLLLCVGFVYLAWSAVTEEQAPPYFVFNVDEITPVGDSFLVELEVTNRGAQSVAGLEVEGELRGEDDKVEVASTQIDYVPSKSRRDIGMYFSTDPRAGTLSFRALGYQEP